METYAKEPGLQRIQRFAVLQTEDGYCYSKFILVDKALLSHGEFIEGKARRVAAHPAGH